jgi:hypothetical protein
VPREELATRDVSGPLIAGVKVWHSASSRKSVVKEPKANGTLVSCRPMKNKLLEY